MRPEWAVVGLLTMAAGCGRAEDDLDVVASPQMARQCAALTGNYKAVFTLRKSEGTCEGAKEESHDPLQFDDDGNFVPPLDGLIECDTVRAGCVVAVRCTSDALQGASARLDATLAPDGSGFWGMSIVSGDYRGCRRVEYAVEAAREYRP